MRREESARLLAAVLVLAVALCAVAVVAAESDADNVTVYVGTPGSGGTGTSSGDPMDINNVEVYIDTVAEQGNTVTSVVIVSDAEMTIDVNLGDIPVTINGNLTLSSSGSNTLICDSITVQSGLTVTITNVNISAPDGITASGANLTLRGVGTVKDSTSSQLVITTNSQGSLEIYDSTENVILTYSGFKCNTVSTIVTLGEGGRLQYLEGGSHAKLSVYADFTVKAGTSLETRSSCSSDQTLYIASGVNVYVLGTWSIDSGSGGLSVTNYGNVVVQEGGYLYLASGKSITNNGSITVQDGATYSVKGSVKGNAIQTADGTIGGILYARDTGSPDGKGTEDDPMDLETALNDVDPEYSAIDVAGTFTLDSSYTTEKSIIISGEATITLESDAVLTCDSISVSNGGFLEIIGGTLKFTGDGMSATSTTGECYSLILTGVGWGDEEATFTITVDYRGGLLIRDAHGNLLLELYDECQSDGGSGSSYVVTVDVSEGGSTSYTLGTAGANGNNHLRVTIGMDMTISDLEMYTCGYSPLEVLDGVTVTLTGSWKPSFDCDNLILGTLVIADGGDITASYAGTRVIVGEGGKVVVSEGASVSSTVSSFLFENRGLVSVEENADFSFSMGEFYNTLDGVVNVSGFLEVGESAEFVNCGTIYVLAEGKLNGVDRITSHGDIIRERDTSDAVMNNELVSSIVISDRQTVTLISDFHILEDTMMVVQGVLVVPEGCTLTVEGVLLVDGGTVEVYGDLVVLAEGGMEATITGQEFSTEHGLEVQKRTITVEVEEDGVETTYEYEIEGTILVYGTVTLDEADDGTAGTMLLGDGGFVDVDGLLAVSEGSVLTVDGRMRVYGELSMGGALSSSTLEVSSSNVIYNWHLITLDGSIDSNVEIHMMSSAAVVDVKSLSNTYYVEQDGEDDLTSDLVLTVVVDGCYESTDGSEVANESSVKVTIPAYVPADDDDEEKITTLSGLKVSTSERTAVVDGEDVLEVSLDISGDVTSDGEVSAILYGDTAVSGAMTIGEGFSVDVNGDLLVTGYVEALDGVLTSSAVDEDKNAYRNITVEGMVVTSVEIDDRVNAVAYYDEEGNRVYTSLGQAVDENDENVLTVLGSVSVSTDVDVPSGISVSMSEGSVLTIEEGSTVTFLEGSVLTTDAKASDSSTIEVLGTLVLDVAADTLSTVDEARIDIVSDVMIENGSSRIYNNIYDAIANASEGDIITLNGDVYLDRDLVIPEGVTLVVPDDCTLTVGTKATLTVEGVLEIDGGTVVLEDSKSGLAVTGSIVSSDPIDEELLAAAGLPWYSVTENRETTYYAMPLEDAVAHLGEADDNTVYVTVEIKAGDVEVAGGSVVVTETGDLEASLDLTDGSLEVRQGGLFDGIVSDASGYVLIEASEGMAFDVVDSDGSLTVSGDFGRIAVYGEVSVSGDLAAEDILVSVDGSLSVPEGCDVSAGTVTVLGSMSGDGTLTATNIFVGVVGDDLGGAQYTTASFSMENVVLEDGGYALALAGTGFTCAYDSTDLYVDGALWATAYANGQVRLGVIGEVPVTNGVLLGWSATEGGTVLIDDEYIGVEKAYAVIDYEIYWLVIRADAGIADVYIEGYIMQKADGDVFYAKGLRAGTYAITWTLVAGYTGEASLRLLSGDDAVLSGTSVTLSGTDGVFRDDDGKGWSMAELQLTGVHGTTGAGSGSGSGGSSGGDDGGMTVIDWLLVVVIVIVFIMMVVLIARLMRS